MSVIHRLYQKMEVLHQLLELINHTIYNYITYIIDDIASCKFLRCFL